MDPATRPAPGLLLLQGNSALRKTLRRELERDGYAILAVNTIGEAVARLRTISYRLVVCTDAQRSVAWSDDYELLIDTRGLLARSGGRYELYLPGIGVRAQAVLIMPCADSAGVPAAVAEVMTRLDLMSAPREAAGPSPPRVSAKSSAAGETSSTAATSTATLYGSEPAPSANRACFPIASPKICTITSDPHIRAALCPSSSEIVPPTLPTCCTTPFHMVTCPDTNRRLPD
jgi:CheY-like chemotaxis protein